MKKRSSITPLNSSTTIDHSSSSSSSSSSSCMVDDRDRDRDHDHDQQNDEEDKPILHQPKKARRKRVSINSNSTKKCPIANANTTTTNGRSSIYRGVTRHRWTGRFEAHLWDKASWNSIQNKKGRQVYLGAYDSEVDAARTYDLAALKYWGPETTLNFPIENYGKELEEMQNVSKEEYLASLRRRSSGFSRGVSKYRGVARHHHNGRWEARIGRVFGNKYLYLGTFSSQEEAAEAYDLAAIEYRGPNAVTNFDINNYIGRVKNLMPKADCHSQNPIQTDTKHHQQEYQEEQHKEKEEQDDQQQEKQEQDYLLQEEILKQEDEQMAIMPLKLEESKIEIDPNEVVVDDGKEKENPWSFCLDYDPDLLFNDIPFLEEDGSVLDLFDQTGFEENIDFIFDEGEGGLISMDEIMASSNSSSPSSITSLVSCQL